MLAAFYIFLFCSFFVLRCDPLVLRFFFCFVYSLVCTFDCSVSALDVYGRVGACLPECGLTAHCARFSRIEDFLAVSDAGTADETAALNAFCISSF